MLTDRPMMIEINSIARLLLSTYVVESTNSLPRKEQLGMALIVDSSASLGFRSPVFLSTSTYWDLLCR